MFSKFKYSFFPTFLLVAISLFNNSVNAQSRRDTLKDGRNNITGLDLNTYYISKNKTIQIVSPEKIKYVDIATHNADGDLPVDNIARIKASDSAKAGDKVVVSVTTDQFLITYNLIVIDDSIAKMNKPNYPHESAITYIININPNLADQFYTFGKIGTQQFKSLAYTALTKKREIYNISTKKYGMEVSVNNIYTAGDYIILDITATNHTKLQYDVSDVVFRLIDKNVMKSAISQEIQLRPEYSLYPNEGTVIRKKWRNIYLLKKVSYPSEKILTIDFGEEPISGRSVSVTIDYNQILTSTYLD